jgi:maltose alpha-D-glucosyltransferase/alpha-amylase
LLENDKRRWLLLNALLLSLPGTPIIYYGDEIGMGDDIWLPDRHGCRMPMQWTDGPNSGFSTAEKTYLPVNQDEICGYKNLNVAQQEKDPNSYLWATRFLLKARKAHPALCNGLMEEIPTDNPAIFAYWRVDNQDLPDNNTDSRSPSEKRVLCLYNLSDQQQSISLNLGRFKGYKLTNLLAQETNSIGEMPVVKILTPYASHWLRLDHPELGLVPDELTD